MDKENELIQRPTLSFPAFTQPKRPRWLLLLGGIVMLLGLFVIVFGLMNLLG